MRMYEHSRTRAENIVFTGVRNFVFISRDIGIVAPPYETRQPQRVPNPAALPEVYVSSLISDMQRKSYSLSRGLRERRAEVRRPRRRRDGGLLGLVLGRADREDLAPHGRAPRK